MNDRDSFKKKSLFFLQVTACVYLRGCGKFVGKEILIFVVSHSS